MKKADNLIKVFTGSETLVFLLKGRLEGIGITSLIKNDSITAYLESSPPPSIDLFIQEVDLTKADPIITEFFKTNNV
jgi:hypothetical protein